MSFQNFYTAQPNRASVENIGVEPLAKLIIDFFRTSLSMCFIKMIIDLVVDI